MKKENSYNLQFLNSLDSLLSLKEAISIKKVQNKLKLTKVNTEIMINFVQNMGNIIHLDKAWESEELVLSLDKKNEFTIKRLQKWCDKQKENLNVKLMIFESSSFQSVAFEYQKILFRDFNKSYLKADASFVEKAIELSKALNLILSKNSLQVFPRKMIFLDGKLHLVAEDIIDKCLINLDMSKIEKIEEDIESYQENYTLIEVNDFINDLRQMGGNQIRLVLKIFSKDNFNLNLSEALYTNPCLFTNMDGDFIWAANLEKSHEVFDWLYQLGSSIEILDPSHFKIDFFNYCEDRVKKLA